ncbi:MAG: HIT family protein [bacterium]|nr:HIT family protein [bacterium]
MEDCIFCKIIAGKLPCYKIYESDSVVAFLDINPFVKGHLLVVPKNHSRWLWDIEQVAYVQLENEVYKLARALRLSFDTDWIQEVVAGVGVEHTHIHLMPRRLDDGIKEIPVKPYEPRFTDQEFNEIVEKIKKEFA